MSTHTDAAQNGKRYLACGEIQFSLRTIQEYFPQVRRIFIVTDNQRFDIDGLTPSFRAKITFVDHTEIIPAEKVALPTFTSDVISSFLHQIPGLSEIFLYFNDDVFLGAPLATSDLVDELGRPCMDVIATEYPADLDIAKRRSLSKHSSQSGRKFICMEMFLDKFGYIPNYTDTHQFRILTKSLCAEALELWWDQWSSTLFCHRVRQRSAPRFCVLRDWLALHRKTHKLRLVPPVDLWRVFQDFDWEHVSMLLERRPKAFCINVAPERADRFDFLSRHYLENPLRPVSANVLVPEDAFLSGLRNVLK